MFNKDLLEKHIAVDSAVQHGKPCIKGTRIPVHIILEALAAGMDFAAVRKEFLPVNDEDIKASIMYGALLADEQELISQSL